MFKVILWDFDGVIFDSMKIKAEGFTEIFQEYPEMYLQKIREYHYANGGVSRFDRIRYFYKELLQQNITDEIVKHKADAFAQIMQKNLFNKEFLFRETVEFIQKYYQEYSFHIVSGAQEDELRDLCHYLNLSNYFLSINGSPIKKEILVANIIEKYHYKQEEVILIGDSINDYNAAQYNGIAFYGYNNPTLKGYGNYIENFKEFI